MATYLTTQKLVAAMSAAGVSRKDYSASNCVGGARAVVVRDGSIQRVRELADAIRAQGLEFHDNDVVIIIYLLKGEQS